MKTITKKMIFVVAALLVNANTAFSQITWSASDWETTNAGAVLTPNESNDRLVVTNLQSSGKRADLRFKKAFTITALQPFLALKLKTFNAAPYAQTANDAFKMEIIHQYYEQVESSIVQSGFLKSNVKSGTRADSNGDGVDDLFIWDFRSVLGTSFLDGYQIPFATNWTDGTNSGSYRGWLKFTIILELDATATSAAYYEVVNVSTFESVDAAITSLTETSTGISRNGFNTNGLQIHSSNGDLSIYSNTSRTITIYGIDGRVVKQGYVLNEGMNSIGFLKAGIYIVENQKIVVNR